MPQSATKLSTMYHLLWCQRQKFGKVLVSSPPGLDSFHGIRHQITFVSILIKIFWLLFKQLTRVRSFLPIVYYYYEWGLSSERCDVMLDFYEGRL